MEKKDELVAYRMKRAKVTYNEIHLHLDNKLYHTAASRLYYLCYYAVSALLILYGLSPKTHLGVRRLFGDIFIKEGIVSKESGKCFNELYNLRQTGDYDDFKKITKEMVEELSNPAKELIDEIEKLIKKEL